MRSAIIAALLATSAMPTMATEGYVGVYSDPLGTNPCATVPQWTAATLYVLARPAASSAGGITGADFKLEVADASNWYFSFNSAADLTLGNPFTTGVNLSFATCRPPGAAGAILLGTVSVYNAGGDSTT